jgi:putative transcriptional regulator
MTTNSSNIEIGGEVMNNVKHFRKMRNLTRKQLAALIGLSPSYIYFIETDQRNPTISVAIKIAEALNESLDTLFPSKKHHNYE